MSVAHAQDLHLLSVWLGDIHLVVNARSTVEIEREVLETESLLVAESLFVQQQEMVVRALHGVNPEVVAHFQMLAYLFTGEAHGIESVLIFIEIEHIADTDRSLLNDSIHLQRSIESDVGLGNLEHQVEDEIIESAIAEECLSTVDGVLESSDFLVDILIYRLHLGLEGCHEFLIARTVCHVCYLAMHLLVLQDMRRLVVDGMLIDGDGDFRICHADGIVGRIETNHLLALIIGDGLAMAGMVVSEEHQVESRNLLCHLQCCIFLVFLGLDAAVPTAMEETDHNIRVFLLLQLFHPVLGRSHHVLKAETAPEVFCQPVRDGRSNHAEDGNLHTLAVEDDIRFHVRSLGFGVDDVGTDHRTVEFLDPLVVNRMTGLNVVITKGLCVILQVVDHICRHVAFVGGDVVVIVASWLTLQDVAVLQQDQVVLVAQSEGVHVGGHTS